MMSIAGYLADGVLWCPECAWRLYGSLQRGALIIVDSNDEQVVPLFDPGAELHLVRPCAGDCGASVPVPRRSASVARIPRETNGSR